MSVDVRDEETRIGKPAGHVLHHSGQQPRRTCTQICRVGLIKNIAPSEFPALKITEHRVVSAGTRRGRIQETSASLWCGVNVNVL